MRFIQGLMSRCRPLERDDRRCTHRRSESRSKILAAGPLFGAFLATVGAIGATQAATPDVVWSTPLKQPVYNTPQARDGRLYMTSLQSAGPNVFGLDSRSGKLLWTFSTDGSIAVPPTVGPTQVFVASDVGSTHFLRAIDAANGALIWKYTRGQPPECMCSYPSTLTGGLLFAQTDGHSLYAFDPSGAAPSKRLWSFDGDGALLTAPASANGVVIVGSSDRNVYGLDARTGKTLWTGTTGYAFTAAPLIVGTVVVIGDQGGNIDGFDLKTGKALWSFGASGAIDDRAVAAGGTAYLVSEDHNVYALNAANGQTVWQYGMDDYAEQPPVLVGSALIVGNRAGQLLALDGRSGKLLWRTDLGGTPFSAPVLWPSKKAVVLKIDDHALGAFDLATGQGLWRYTSPAVVTLPLVDGANVDLATSAGEAISLH
jgi:eukaryotic-like serine/threonine-protein kinase